MTLLVTGAMGHVGFELVARLAPHRAVLGQYNVRFRDAEAQERAPAARWSACDLTDPIALDRLCRDHAVSDCIHLAAVSNEALAKPDPMHAFHVNAGATVNLLEAARRLGWRRFINCSTGSVFRDADPDKVIPEDYAVDADTIYGATKACGELMTTAFRAQYGLDVVSIRLSRVYGPPIREATVGRGLIPAILIGAMQGELRGELPYGNFQGGFTHIDDVLEGLVAILGAEKLRHAAYNLGPPRNYTIAELVDLVRKLVPDTDIAISFGSASDTTVRSGRGPFAVTRLTADTGFTARIELQEGVTSYHRWLMGRLSLA